MTASLRAPVASFEIDSRRVEASRYDFLIRDAQVADNEGLIALAAACPMVGDISLRIDRGPSFFALNRLEGERWRVGVAERDGVIVGCVGVSERRSYVNGRETRTGYAGDLKVHPEHRDTRIADELSMYSERAFVSLPPTAPVLITVLAGNRSMERRLPGPRGVPAFTRIGMIRTHSVPILWRRRVGGSIRIAPATWNDVAEMAALWKRVAPLRQLVRGVTVATADVEYRARHDERPDRLEDLGREGAGLRCARGQHRLCAGVVIRPRLRHHSARFPTSVRRQAPPARRRSA